MGSISSLSQDMLYIFTVEALDASEATLSSASTETSTGEALFRPFLYYLST